MSIFHGSSNTAGSTSRSRSSTQSGSQSSISLTAVSWLSLLDQKATDAISSSPRDFSFDYLGCFPLGFNVTTKNFSDVVHSQQQLKDLNLLDNVKEDQLQEMGMKFKLFCETLSGQDIRHGPNWLVAVQELAHMLCGLAANDPSPVRAHIGLDSGFQIQPGTRFWAVYGLSEDGILDIYISRSVPDITSAILHTYLSSQGCRRHECFQMEIKFALWSNNLVRPSCLPGRILNDIALLSPAELLKFVQHLNLTPVTKDSTLIDLLRAACGRHLLDSTDFTQLKELSTTGYLSGRASARDLINSRIQWYRQAGCQYPDPSIALENFLQIDVSVTEILKHRNILALKALTECLASCISLGRIDSRVDLMAFWKSVV